MDDRTGGHPPADHGAVLPLPHVKIDAFATEPQYLAHLAPIWFALDPSERGQFYTAGIAAERAVTEGIPALLSYPPQAERITMIASYQDERTCVRVGRPVVYVEHGAGQTYRGDRDEDHPSYSGTAEHGGVRLFLCPSETVASRWRDRYPHTPAIAVGCPKLDGWTSRRSERMSRARDTRPVVALSFHADVRWCPESSSSWRYYNPHLPEMIEVAKNYGCEVIGHSHPRLATRLADRWRQLGVEYVDDFATVLDRGDVYCSDNTSTLPEAAAAGLSVVWMNAPWYRRDVHHGGRFWEWPQGQPMIDGPEDWPWALSLALDPPAEMVVCRERMVRSVYEFTDGQSANRAADAIRSAMMTPA